MKTAVVILNWNTEGFLRKFLPSLIDSVKASDAEVIVADNASTDGSIKVMTEEFPYVRTIRFDSNLGFTGGYNKALSQIEAEYYLLINSDIEVSEGWLEPLVEWMDSNPSCGACAPKLHSYDRKEMFEYAGAAGGYIDRYGYPFCRGRILKRVEKDNGQYDDVAKVFWATGACLMVRAGLFNTLGGLDERFFAHMEEIDLCWRMQLHGYDVCVIPDSTVYHVGGGTLPNSSPFKLFLNYRNNLLMLYNNLSLTYSLMYFKKGMNITKAAVKGQKKAEWIIWQRKVLDMMSATVYLLTFRSDYFRSVIRAHKEVAEKVKVTDTRSITDYLQTHGKHSSVTGVYSRWIILRSILKGNGIFKSIKEKDFYKI